jgi:hypothetical protein
MAVSSRTGKRPIVELPNDYMIEPWPIHFSPDSRRLAWGGQNGVITVADIEALFREVAAFEKEILAP